MANLILMLGDQLSHQLSALEGADKDNDRVVMAEVHDEASYTNHHKKKLIYIFSVMRHFADWTEGRKQLRMEFFYREMRKKTGLLMTPEGKPEGGQWNFDSDNRKKWSGKPPAPAPFNPRMAMMYRNWDKQPDERRRAILSRGEWLLANLEQL